MKDFMLIFLGANYAKKGLSPEQMQERMGKWFAWNEKMRVQGIVGDGHALEAHGRRVSGPDRIVTDSLAVESQEFVGGYYIVKADSYESALKIAQDFPDYDLDGTVEIREVMVFN